MGPKDPYRSPVLNSFKGFLFAFFNDRFSSHSHPHPAVPSSMQAITSKNPPTLPVIEKAANTPSLANKEGIGLIDQTAGMRRWDF
jgi:hypothetical protein